MSVLAILLGLGGGGLRVASEVSAAAGFARTAQLAVLGQQVTALAQALESERDLTVAYMAAGGWDRSGSGNGVPIVSAAAHTADRNAMTGAQALTDMAAQRVRALAGQIGGSFPASAQSQAQQVVTQIGYLGALRSQSQGQPSSSAITDWRDRARRAFPGQGPGVAAARAPGGRADQRLFRRADRDRRPHRRNLVSGGWRVGFAGTPIVE